MENEILDSLNDLGYEGQDEVAFAKALDGGPKSLEYTKLVHILAEELKRLCNVEETISMMNSPDESSSFLLELSSFLKELGCPYKKLVTGLYFGTLRIEINECDTHLNCPLHALN
ncbi:jg3583 [Pararge aegeria aegeria]|uniref:Jg3583 protein n=1 Tax=Pararge aegeria aegeria TaxID=348720 RepID=A0A8S4SCW2_9NEOP|nr:jg3583 [Pararge aegeria aegeria]